MFSLLKLDFLSSDVMHGEGSVVAHLAIVGYNVTYQQVRNLDNFLPTISPRKL